MFYWLMWSLSNSVAWATEAALFNSTGKTLRRTFIASLAFRGSGDLPFSVILGHWMTKVHYTDNHKGISNCDGNSGLGGTWLGSHVTHCHWPWNRLLMLCLFSNAKRSLLLPTNKYNKMKEKTVNLIYYMLSWACTFTVNAMYLQLLEIKAVVWLEESNIAFILRLWIRYSVFAVIWDWPELSHLDFTSIHWR